LRYLRALGWAAFAGAPVLIATLAVAASRPQAPGSLITRALWAGWIAGALAFVAALLHHRGAERPARVVGAFAGVVVALWLGFLVWLSAALA